MGNALLPDGWQVRWAREPASDGLSVMVSALVVKSESVSMAFLEHGLRAWGRSEDKLGPITIDMPEIPRLDDVWCLYMLAAREQDQPRHGGWEAMAHYVEDVRRGYWPDRVNPEHAVQAVFSAIVHEHLAGTNPTRDEFLAEALELCRHVDTKLKAGADVLASDTTDSPKLRRHRAALASDHKLYDEDVRRSRRWFARIPANRADGRERKVPLLVLRSPIARQFKMWARVDPRAPGGHGYPLLLVDLGKGEIVLSADPTAKLKIGWLAEGLDKLEGGDARWYDGSRHGFTMVAAPKAGTRLSLDAVVGHLNKELALGRVWNHRLIRMASIGGAAAVMLGVSAFIIIRVLTRNPGQEIANANRDALYLVQLPSGAPCTAFVIGAHELATAAHCVTPPSAGETILIRNGHPEDRRPVVRSYVHKDGLDIGVLVVRDPLPSPVRLGTESDLVDAQGTPIFVFAFIQDGLNKKHPVARMDTTTVSTPPTQTRLDHNGATSGGSSGGPIFNADGRVIAVHTGVIGNEFNQETRFAGGVPAHRLEELRSNAALQMQPQ